MAGNSSFSAAITRTLQYFDKEIVDGVSQQNALTWLLKAKGNIKVRAGGRTFTHPLLYGLNSSFRTYAKYGTIDTPDPDIITRSEWNQRILAGSIVMSYLERAQNAGDKEKLLDYAEEKKLEAEVSFGEALATQLWQTTPGANDFNSIRQIVSDDPTTDVTANVGGIDPTSSVSIGGTTLYPWRNQNYTTAVSAFNTSSNGLTALSTLLNNCSFGPRSPKVVITTKAIWSLYDVGQAGNRRYTHADLADAGFQNLDYAGLPVLADTQCPASHLYMLDTDALWLQVLRDGNMITTEPAPTTNQLSETVLMYMFANLTAGGRRTHGVATSITG